MICDMCDGEGVDDEENWCAKCGGTGEIDEEDEEQ